MWAHLGFGVKKGGKNTDRKKKYVIYFEDDTPLVVINQLAAVLCVKRILDLSNNHTVD